MTRIITKSREDTLTLARQLGAAVRTGMNIALKGDLGSGKTTFVQGFADGLNISKKYYVTSPTFNIINTYPADPLTLCHIDLYRIGSADELDHIGFEDLPGEDSILVVEWPRILEELSFAFDLEIRFEFDDNDSRIISFFPYGQAASNLINSVILQS